MRYFPRWKVDERVVYHLDGESEPREGATRDISCAGACIVGEGPIEPHQKVKITVELAERTKIKLNGYILWARNKDGQLHMGVTFYDTPDEVQDLILQHAFELDKEKVLKQWYKGWEDS